MDFFEQLDTRNSTQSSYELQGVAKTAPALKIYIFFKL
uniref:Uncharacterized protein n=1 Tax=Nesodiprion zhejiangensis nucleopolyhedrovirus TaxID=3135970 RepID=A0AAN0N626_9BACU